MGSRALPRMLFALSPSHPCSLKLSEQHPAASRRPWCAPVRRDRPAFLRAAVCTASGGVGRRGFPCWAMEASMQAGLESGVPLVSSAGPWMVVRRGRSCPPALRQDKIEIPAN